MRLRLLCVCAWMSAAVLAAPGRAQGFAAGALDTPAMKRRTTAVRFDNEKAVLGLPLGVGRERAHCSLDGTVFYDPSSSAAGAGQDLYAVSQDGNVKHLLRKLPMDYTHVVVRDFFAGDKQLVTLLEADKRDSGGTSSPSRETEYFLSLEDDAGDGSDLVPLQLKFRPLKVARFATGDVVVLGWDEGNLLPMLASVRGDGTIRRFVDLDGDRRSVETSSAKQMAAQERATMELLQGAAFVATDGGVLLTYPGTTKSAQFLSVSGELRSIPLAIPGGFVLNDVLVSSGRGTMVIRVREAPQSKAVKDDTEQKPNLRVMETANGFFLRELMFERPPAADLTCAVHSTLSAIFYDTIPDANHALTNGGAVDTPAAGATQLVIATVRR